MRVASPPSGRTGRWREHSRLDHQAAEASPFVRDLVAGQVQPATYLRYLLMLQSIYGSLEAQFDRHRRDPVLAAVDDGRLRRAEALSRDIEVWRRRVGDRAGHVAAGSPAATAYVDRIEDAGDRPHLLVAHAYTRYLGDLSGGRVLGACLRRATGSDEGLSFYDFPGIDAVPTFRDHWRSRADALQLSPSADAEILDEVRAGFVLSRGLFEELESGQRRN